ncbi:MAG: M4 family metallopeptidase, partial [Anaerolineae bacterium]
MSVVSPPPPSQGPTPMTSGPADAVLIDRLQQSTGGKVRLSYHARTGKVRFIGTDLEHPIPQLIELATAATPEQAARQFLDTYGQLFGLTDQAQELTVMHTKTADRGRPFVRFQQVYHGIPVLGGEVIVQLDAEKNVISANGEILPDLELNITPKLDIITAQEVARRFVAKGYGLSANDLQVSEPELWVYNPILLKPGLNLSSLVWRMDVYPTDLRPIDELVLIDAHRGAVILHFNQVDAARNREVYDNRNDRDAGLPGYGPVRTEGQAPTGIRDVDKAYDYAGDTYDFYLNMHGRDSLDNAGMPLVSTVRYCDSDPDEDCPLNNAFWWGRYQQIAYGQGYITDDVVTHEMTHGVTDFESNLFYYMQSGAINEAFSDIWGEFVDLTNDKGNDSDAVRWLHAEDLPTGANRNMKDPPNPPNPCGTWPCNDRQPDRMSNSTYYYCGELDNGGVHTNSGIGNKAAYLMVDGGTFSSHTITGIGIEKTAKILYEVQTLMFTSAADYNDLYDALQQACTNLIGTNGITAFDCQQVEKAVDATEMSQQPTACPAIEAPLCPAGEVPTNMFFDDLESGVDNWTTDTIIGTEGIVSGPANWGRVRLTLSQ